jgi:hypothetical protein
MKRNLSTLSVNEHLRRPYRLFLFLSLFLIFNRVRAQNNMVETNIRNTFNQYSSGYIQEKLYVHTDKNFYLPGEILWFRIYDVDASFHHPVDISKLAYVELLDKSNKPVLQEKVSLKPEESSGSFIIPVTIPTGNYTFRAYTRWMRNFGEDYFFSKSIQIVNPERLAADSMPPAADRYDIQFFPEGGNLVQRLESKVGFRVTDAYGKGQDFSGVLLDEQQDTVLKFRPLNMGLGHFSFTPGENKQYKAIILLANGKKFSRALPSAYASGYVMNVSATSKDRLAITVHVSGRPDADMVYLFVHTRGTKRQFQIQQLEKGVAGFSLNTAELGDGISQLTLFDNNGKPVCERLYFKYPEKRLVIAANPGQSAFSTRKEVHLDLSSADQDGHGVKADMSLAVYRLDSLQTMDETDISRYLYLVSDLGPGIESPAYYFEGGAKEEAMDNLLLTRGWRRFKWNEMGQIGSVDIKYAPEYNGHILEGRLVDNKTGSGVSFMETFLSVPSTRAQLRTTLSDTNGYVKYDMRNFYGSQEIILQTDPKDDSSCHFEMRSPFAQADNRDSLPAFPISSINMQQLTDGSVQTQVQRVYLGNKLQQFRMPLMDTSSFYSIPEEKYPLDDYVRFQTMEEVLREYVVSVNVLKRHDKFVLYVFNDPFKTFFAYSPLVLLDGVPIFDIDKLFHLDPLKIRKLDLITRKYFLGYQSFDGIVNLTTYHGDLDGFEMEPHATVLDYPGIPGEREFFEPVYETEQQIASRMPDFRTLLYWAPQVRTDEKGKAGVHFYTSDVPGKYAVVVQGITSSGEPGSQVVYFNVQK